MRSGASIISKRPRTARTGSGAKTRRRPAGKDSANTASKQGPREFVISDMDDLGQGIDRSGDKPLFVAKTLPGEMGQVTPYRQAKGVAFARLEDSSALSDSAANRTEPACPHFQQCPGCQYLHTDYASEQSYKQQSFQRSLRGLKNHPKPLPEVQWIGADQRLHYRNRIQLHYRHSYLGMLDRVSNQVLPIPNCQLLRPELKPALQDLYARHPEQPAGSEQKKHGHVELYLQTDGQVTETWDQPYAAGGFTQVNAAMHEKLLQQLESSLQKLKQSGFEPDNVLDCFAGDGNLSRIATEVWPQLQRICVDRYPQAHDAPFLSLDLYEDEALSRYLARAPHRKSKLMIVDPPRSGFPRLAQWTDKMQAHYLVYIACDARTMIRDLNALSQHRILELLQFDLFPATHHYESMAVVRLKAGKSA